MRKTKRSVVAAETQESAACEYERARVREAYLATGGGRKEAEVRDGAAAARGSGRKAGVRVAWAANHVEL